MKTFGERLQLCLELRNKKPIDMANDLGMSKGNISKYINGKLSTPTIRIVKKFADYLNVAPSYLLGLSDQIYIPTIKPLNSLHDDKEVEMKRAIMSEVQEIVSQQDLETMQTMLNIIRTLAK